jgi:uncharacterized tellurite resistance protein B-like protein
MQQLKRDERIALARIIIDLIEADFVIEAGEMDFFERAISKECFNITDKMLVEAKKIDLAKALEMLKEIDIERRKALVQTLKQLSLSDDECVASEATLIYAIEQVLLGNANLYSILKPDIEIANLTAIYVENEASATGENIASNLAEITESLRVAGLDFVYIPTLVDDFRAMDAEYLRKSVKYKIPSSSEERVLEICEKLCGLTTAQFCRDLLYKKLKLNLIDCRPSLLVKINDSDIIDRHDSEENYRLRFSNFLQVELGEDVEHDISAMVETYRSMVNAESRQAAPSREAKFIYEGFHRSLFDLIAYGRESHECRLVFDFRVPRNVVYFESMEGAAERIPLKLNPQETTLYYIMVKHSLEGEGLDWRENIPAEAKTAILREYNEVYYRVGHANRAFEYKDRTQVHHIKNRLRLLTGIANIDMFIPEHIRSGSDSAYRVRCGGRYVAFRF